jgi:hypothetical protein
MLVNVLQNACHGRCAIDVAPLCVCMSSQERSKEVNVLQNCQIVSLSQSTNLNRTVLRKTLICRWSRETRPF